LTETKLEHIDVFYADPFTSALSALVTYTDPFLHSPLGPGKIHSNCLADCLSAVSVNINRFKYKHTY